MNLYYVAQLSQEMLKKLELLEGEMQEQKAVLIEIERQKELLQEISNQGNGEQVAQAIRDSLQWDLEKLREENESLKAALKSALEQSNLAKVEYDKALAEKAEMLKRVQQQYRELSELTAQIQEEGKRWRNKYLRVKKEIS